MSPSPAAARPLPGNFDPVASYYDRLSRWVFGDTLWQAKTRFLAQIPAGATIIMPGAGTAQELQVLQESGFTGTVYVIEASARMLQRAQKAQARLGQSALEIHWVWVHADKPLQYPPADVVITHFFMDLFAGELLQQQQQALHQALVTGGLWLWADFIPLDRTHKTWQRGLVWVMYRFFRLTCGIQAARLPQMPSWFGHNGYHRQAQDHWLRGMVEAGLWQKDAT